MDAPEILFSCIDDWANVAYLLQESMRAVGVNALAVTQKPHGFDYADQATIMPYKEQQALADESKIVVHMHSRMTVKPTKEGVHHVAFHGGAKYRFAAAQNNNQFNKFVDCTLIQTADLLGLGAKNEEWILPPIDLKAIKPKFGILDTKVKVAHYPRSAREKGSVAINRVMAGIKKDKALGKKLAYTYDSTRVEWAKNIERMRQCDIYIETMAPLHMKHPHGVWGMTALEAAALGKIVVTNFKGLKRYESEYGPCALQVADTEEQLDHVMRRLLAMSVDELESLQITTREWVEKYHSFEAVGKRLKAVFDKHCYAKHQTELQESDNVVSQEKADDAGEPTSIPSTPGPAYTPAWWEVYGRNHTLPRKLLTEESAIVQNWILQGKMLQASFLDVACGSGPIYNILRGRGVDLPNFRCCDCVNSLRFRFREITGMLPDYWDGGRLPYEDNSFDVVMLFDTLQFLNVNDAVALAKELKRVSRDMIMVSAFTGSRNISVNNRYHVHGYQELWKSLNLKELAASHTDDGNRTIWLLGK